MFFDFENKRFKLSFERSKKEVVLLRKKKVVDFEMVKNQETGFDEVQRRITYETVKKTQMSKHPFTTVKLILVPKSGVAPMVFAKGVVGCFIKDKYSPAVGRSFALKSLTEELIRMRAPEGLVSAVWDTYNNRRNLPHESLAAGA